MPMTHHTFNKYNKTTAILVCIVSVVAGVVGIGLLARRYIAPSCDKLRCITAAGSDAWKEADLYEHTDTTYRALLTAPSYTIRIEKNSYLSFEDATLLTKVRTMQISGLFDDARSPYPGILSDRIRCDEQFKPHMQQINSNGLTITYFSAGLNNRLQFGTCKEDELPYKSHTAIFYCPKEKTLYQLELIAKKEEPDAPYTDIIRSIRCLPPYPLF